MRIDSNKLGSNIYNVCSDCGNKAMELPENKGKNSFSVSTCHKGTCDVCREIKSVTEARDYGYPVFEVEGLLEKN